MIPKLLYDQRFTSLHVVFLGSPKKKNVSTHYCYDYHYLFLLLFFVAVGKNAAIARPLCTSPRVAVVTFGLYERRRYCVCVLKQYVTRVRIVVVSACTVARRDGSATTEEGGGDDDGVERTKWQLKSV
jgi:hypothetical protein